ncbi:MAG TPA: YciI family protein [Opitutaceae bacterium]|jgi:uncharacterized protein YciI|nr:YciI family protein [Opitutaceae bacterium]
MEQFIYRIVPTRPEMILSGPTEEERAAITAHFEHLEGLASKGIVLLAGRTMGTAEKTYGIVILAAENAEAAKELMMKDPAVARGVMHHELHSYRVAVLSKNWIGES